MKKNNIGVQNSVVERAERVRQALVTRNSPELSDVQVQCILASKLSPLYNDEKLKQIALKFEHGLTVEHVSTYTKPKFKYDQMCSICTGFGNRFNNSLTIEQIITYANPEYTYKQMEAFRLGFKHGLTVEQILPFVEQKFTLRQIYQIMNGFGYGLTIDQILTYAKPEFSLEQMVEVRNELILSNE